MFPTNKKCGKQKMDAGYNQIQELSHQKADYQTRLKLGAVLYQYLTFNSATANPQHR